MVDFHYNGKTHFYNGSTIFYVEEGRYEGTYKKLDKFSADELHVAISLYERLRVSKGYKKRLVMSNNGMRTIIAREISERETDESKST